MPRSLVLPGDDVDLDAVAASDSALRRFLHGLPGVDQVGLEHRVAKLATRSLKRETKTWALDLAVSMVDLTTLEGADTPGRVRSLVAKALRPDPSDPDCPAAAAVCVYPDRVADAVAACAGRGGDAAGDGPPLHVASVATAFPSGRANREVKLLDTRQAIEDGADEVDMVIDRGAFLAGRYGQVFDEIATIKRTCDEIGAEVGREVHLKVILETGELGGYDQVRRASWLALAAGGDVIKTSTGKVSPAATIPVTAVLLQAVRDWHALTGEYRGVKAAGGIRTAKDALRYLVVVHEVAGPAWLHPDRFRFGASSLLDDLLLQRAKQRTGHYWTTDRLAIG